MAIITPLIDTLLHEVLGRRMDAPRTPLNPPVAPVYPGKAAQAVQGDSRLQSRGGALLVQDALPAGSGQAQGKAPHPTARGPASAYASLSPAAQLIGTVLDRFPAPPSVIRTPEPLLQHSASLLSGAGAAGSHESLQTGRQLLQEALRSSISNSGLFYESHLKAWFGGRLPLEHLFREPQARAFQASTAAPAPAVEEGGRESIRLGAPLRELPENLHSLIRHQLELLVSPVLRWEGEIWPGLFMSLILDVPRSEADEAAAEEGQPEERAGDCRAELQLHLDGLGAVDAKFNLVGARLGLAIATDSPALLTLMRSKQEPLVAALGASGLQVDLEIALTEIGDDREG